jgi:hypothetical protein
MPRYLLCREGIQPIHDGIRGPVAPVSDPDWPNGGHLNGSYRVVHDAGAAFVVWVHGPDAWLEDYVDTLPESISSESFDKFVQQCAIVAGDGSLRGKLALSVLDSLGVVAKDVSQDEITKVENFIVLDCVTAPEVPDSDLIADLASKLEGGVMEKIPDAAEIAEKELTP